MPQHGLVPRACIWGIGIALLIPGGLALGQDLPPKAATWQQQPVSDELIDQAVKAATKYLYKYAEQSPSESWESIKPTEYDAAVKDATKNGGTNSVTGQYTGVTSLVLMALLKSGADENDPHIQKAVKFVMSARPTQTYANGLRGALLGTVRQKTQQAYKKEIDFEKQWLMDAIFKSGMYSYNPPADDNPRP